jgi:hypothetical protein
MEAREEFNLLNLGAKAQSKHELYKLLTNDGDFYFPPYKQGPVDFIASVLKGEKKVKFCFFLPTIIVNYRFCAQRTYS